jgi:hypothetical protein
MREHRLPQRDLERLDLARRGELLLRAQHVEHGHVAEVHREVGAVLGALWFGYNFGVVAHHRLALDPLLVFALLDVLFLGTLRDHACDPIFTIRLERGRRDGAHGCSELGC